MLCFCPLEWDSCITKAWVGDGEKNFSSKEEILGKNTVLKRLLELQQKLCEIFDRSSNISKGEN